MALVGGEEVLRNTPVLTLEEDEMDSTMPLTLSPEHTALLFFSSSLLLVGLLQKQFFTGDLLHWQNP